MLFTVFAGGGRALRGLRQENNTPFIYVPMTCPRDIRSSKLAQTGDRPVFEIQALWSETPGASNSQRDPGTGPTGPVKQLTPAYFWQ